MDCCSKHPVKRLWSGRGSSSMQRNVLLVLLCIITAVSTEREEASRRTNIARCRDSCIYEFLSSVKGNSAHAQRDECLKTTICAGCWDSCEKLRKDRSTGNEICKDTSICPKGCMHACRFYKLGQQQDDEMDNREPRRQNPFNTLSNIKPQSLKANQNLYADQESPEIVSILESPREIDFFGCAETKCLLWIALTMLVIILLAGWVIILMLKLKILKSDTMHVNYSSEIERQTV